MAIVFTTVPRDFVGWMDSTPRVNQANLGLYMRVQVSLRQTLRGTVVKTIAIHLYAARDPN